MEATLILICIAAYIALNVFLAKKNGRNWKVWLFLAFAFPIVSTILLWKLPSKRKLNSRETTKMPSSKKSSDTMDNKQKPPKQKKSYTEEFKKEVVSTALTSGESINSVAAMYDVNPTLVRNWKEKYEDAVLAELNQGTDDEDNLSDEVSDEMIDDVLADFEEMLLSKSVLHGLGIKGLVGVRLSAEAYDDELDDGARKYKVLITIESTVNQKLSDDMKENISDLVQDFIRENEFDDALSDIGADPDLFNWFPVEIENVNGSSETHKGGSNANMSNSSSTENDTPVPTLIWHIDRAKFVFSDPSEYREWKKEKKVFFEFSPANSDDGGEAVFVDPDTAEDDFEITEDRGVVKIKLEKDGPLITVWVGVTAPTVNDLDEELLNEWANDQGGWASCSIHLGDFDATIDSDDGGDWRFPMTDEN